MQLIQLNKIEGARADEDGLEIENTVAVSVNPNAIRCFYARRGGKPGTRLTFVDGGGFAVSETPEAVTALIPQA